jgi:hypothetical protein
MRGLMIKVGGWSLCHNHREVNDRSSSVLLIGTDFVADFFLSQIFMKNQTNHLPVSLQLTPHQFEEHLTVLGHHFIDFFHCFWILITDSLDCLQGAHFPL